ncbi:MAG: hypothetical protein ACAI18_14980 [Gemmatimonadales bacterium]
MVEYAMVLAGTSLGSFAAAAKAFVSRLDWEALLFGALALVALRIAFWAFKLRA